MEQNENPAELPHKRQDINLVNTDIRMLELIQENKNIIYLIFISCIIFSGKEALVFER